MSVAKSVWFCALAFWGSGGAFAATDVFSTAGSFSWTAPAGVTSVTVEAWGGGGAGGGQNQNSDGGGGGGGGGYAKKNTVAVFPGSTYTVVVGAGGVGVAAGTGGAGSDSYFINAATVLAKGGAGGAPSTGSPPAGGAGGAAAAGVGDVRFSGGNGGRGRDNGTGRGGPGGSSAGTAANGTSGPDPWTTATAGAAPAGGGIGGDGGNANGANGEAPASGSGGGGGGSAEGNNRTGGSGADGKVIISYADPPTVATGAASALTPGGATLNGVVSSNGATTTVSFDYGPTVAYGTTVPAAESPLAAGASNASVTAAITGLTCNGVYHFRVRGVSAVGSANGGDQTFTPPCPAVLSIQRASPNPSTANATVRWTVTFNMAVSGVDASDFLLIEAGGASGASLGTVASVSGSVYTVEANSGSASTGTVALRLVDDDSIAASGQLLGGSGIGNGSLTGEAYNLVPPAPNLSKSASAASAVLGDVVSFNITVTNPYGVALSNVVVTDVLPAGMSYSAFAVTLGSASVVGQTATWTIPTLPAGGSAQMTLAAALTQTGVLTNTVTSPGAVSASANVLVLASAVTHFRFDEPVGSWNGTTGEVIDSGGTALHGARMTTNAPTTTNVVDPVPSIASQRPGVVGSFCSAGQFDGRAVVRVASSNLFDYTNRLSATAWVYPTAYPSGGSDLYSILSNDTNYEFHLNPSGRLYWWWQASNLTSATTVPLNQWTHVAITMDSRAGVARQRIYINGVLDTNVGNWSGTLATNNCDFHIGGDIATGAACSFLPARNFRGMIDEVKLYSNELSASEVRADMELGRLCAGAFDHIRIEHDGSGSICNPETVTVKACLNSACTALYGGNVTVRLSPSGWVGGDTFTLTGGVATRQLSQGSAGNVALGTVSVAPAPASRTRCFNGGSETCNIAYAAASCAFDVAETGGAPRSRLLTKRAGAPFSVDLLALSTSTTINTAYTGAVSVDLVDASVSTCPSTYPGLIDPPVTATFSLADAGRKAVTITAPVAAKNVRVRARVGAGLPACSFDNFAVRPDAVALSSPSVFPVKAGAPFTLLAGGYAGSVTLDSSRLSVASGGTVGSLTPATLTVNESPAPSGNATYSEVGNLALAAGAYRDDDFAAVDKRLPAGCDEASTCDCISDPTGDKHLSAAVVGTTGRVGCSVGSSVLVLGRFIPDHFNVEPTGPMACAGLTPALTCPPGGMAYSGQPFALTVTAKNALCPSGPASCGTTRNYRYSSDGDASNDFSRDLTLTAVNAAGGTAIATTAPGGTLTNVTVPKEAFSDGVAALVSPTSPAFEFVSLFTTAPTDVHLRARESAGGDDVSSLQTVAADSVEGGVKIVRGRVRVDNAYGSEKLALPLPAQVQFWNGNYWQTSATDSGASVLADAGRKVSGTAVDSVKVSYKPGSSWASAAGRFGLTLGATGVEAVDLLFSLDASPWLKYPWNGCTSGSPPNCPAVSVPPKAKASFGLFPGSKRFIYRREVR